MAAEFGCNQYGLRRTKQRHEPRASSQTQAISFEGERNKINNKIEIDESSWLWAYSLLRRDTRSSTFEAVEVG